MSRCLSEGKCQQRGVLVPIFIDANADVLKAVSGRSFVCLNDSNSTTPWLSLLILQYPFINPTSIWRDLVMTKLSHNLMFTVTTP